MATRNDLNDRQRVFVSQYLVDLCATDAAIRAGYSPTTAQQIAYQLLQKTSVRDAIERAMNERAARTGIAADAVLTLLEQDVMADVADLFRPDGTIRPVRSWPSQWRRGLVERLVVREVWSGEGRNRAKIGQVVEIVFADRTSLKKLLGRHLGAF
jgi:phage terminase small subunit